MSEIIQPKSAAESSQPLRDPDSVQSACHPIEIRCGHFLSNAWDTCVYLSKRNVRSPVPTSRFSLHAQGINTDRPFLQAEDQNMPRQAPRKGKDAEVAVQELLDL